MTRKLTLRGQVLAELNDGELRDVAGGVTIPPGVCVGEIVSRVCAVASCVIECASLFEPCVTSTC